MSKTETVHTAYGDVDIDVVDCDSCGNRVAKEDTVEFTIGDREGLACHHCRDKGPVSFPEPVFQIIKTIENSSFDRLILMSVLPWLVMIVAFFEYPEDKFQTAYWSGFTHAIVLLTLWGLIWVGLYFVVL